jgi:hypothetical protein
MLTGSADGYPDLKAARFCPTRGSYSVLYLGGGLVRSRSILLGSPIFLVPHQSRSDLVLSKADALE